MKPIWSGLFFAQKLKLFIMDIEKIDYQFITSKALLSMAGIKFSVDDYQTIGERISNRYVELYGKKAEKVMTINSKKIRVKPCSLYPAEFEGEMQEIISNYYSNG